jgi:hypothetical protein
LVEADGCEILGKWGYEEAEKETALTDETIQTAQSDHDAAEGVESDVECALNSSSGL